MSLACLRVYARHRLALGAQEYATPTIVSRSRERKNEGLVLQYVGKLRKPNHKVFVWGFSYTGALGIPRFEVPDSGRKKPRKYQLTSYRLETEQQISSEACGYVFTLLSSSTKDLTKVWGMVLHRDSQLVFTLDKSYDYVLELSPVPLPLARPRRTGLSYGSSPPHVSCLSFVLSLSLSPTSVFSLGNNAYGQCGRKIAEDEIYRYHTHTHTHSAMNCLHTILLTQLIRLKQCSKCKGKSASAVVMQHGRVYVESLVGKVTQRACGGTQVAIRNERGEVFVWGYSFVPPTLFGSAEFNPAVTINSIHCGLNHFAAVTYRGELFIWGKNVRGCLGIAKKLDQYFSWRVTLPGHVIDVACGVDHMVALVKSVI
uniref:RCC1 like n=1 Tax=Oncorhynchus kisutch TaxID=8019 RepID=A0A8C7FPF2_ONCKI